MAGRFDNVERFVADISEIVDAFEYHEMLQEIEDGDIDTEYEESDDESDSDDDDSDEKSDGEEDGEGDEGQKSVPAEDGEGAEAAKDPDNTDGSDAEDSLEESELERPTFPLFLLNLDDELLLRTSSSVSYECPNAKSRPGMWLKDPELRLSGHGLGFLDQIGNLCIQAKVRRCERESCRTKRDIMNVSAPACQWKSFRDWAVTAMSCQATLTRGQKQTRPHTHIARAVSGCCSTLKDCISKYGDDSKSFHEFLDGPTRYQTDLEGVCNVIFWMTTIQASMGIGPRYFGRWHRGLLPSTLTLPTIEQATNKIQDLGICKNRFWNLVNLSERKELDLPHLVDAIIPSKSSFVHEKHDLCTASKCQFAQMDSTMIKQLHKCNDQDECKQRQFHVDLLETSLELGRGTAWSITDSSLNPPNDPYIAISHVWSDGTGVGVKNAGCVNSCLFNFFADIAKTLDCTGIWWDALSIPAESKARSKALNKMHSNYANAECTVVHDTYLTNFEWKDDGSPCLALVLSPWFTRGWTALELVMSKNVKILYKDPKGGPLLIKDLKDDVLATTPGATSRAHWLVSGFIRRLLKDVDTLGDLLAILKPRSTSWVRDRTVIAGLLTKVPDCDYTRGESEIVRDILRHLGRIPYDCLLHGNVTMCESGGFSWCAATLDDMRVEYFADMEGSAPDQEETTLIIEKNGAVTGDWDYRQVTQRDILGKRLTAHGESLAVKVKIQTALRHWQNCLLLKSDDDSEEGEDSPPWLLVTTVGVGRHPPLIECRYIGAVKYSENDNEVVDSDDEASISTTAQIELPQSWDYETIRIGNDEGKVEISARIAMKRMNKIYKTIGDDDSDNDDSGTDHGALSEPGSAIDSSSDEEEAKSIPLKSDKVPDENDRWFRRLGALLPSAIFHSSTHADEAPEDLPDSDDDDDEEHLFVAIRKDNEQAARHLIKNGVDLSNEAKMGLADRLGSDKKYTFQRIQTLGDIYLQNHEIEKAQYMYERAVEGFKKVCPTDAVRTLVAMHSLGSIYVKQGNLDRAKDLFMHIRQACDKKNKKMEQKKPVKPAEPKPGPSAQTPSKGMPPPKTSSASKSKQSSKGAAPPNVNPAAKSTQVQPKDSGPDKRTTKWHEVELDTIADLSLLYAEKDAPNDAAKTYRFSLKRFGKPPRQVDTFASNWGDQSNFISHEDRTEKQKEAEDIYSRALKQFELELSKAHMLTLITALNLGSMYEAGKKHQEARPLFKRAVEGLEKTLGEEHIMTIYATRRFAINSSALNKPDEAQMLYRHVLNALERKYITNHRFTATAASDLGTHYLAQQMPKKAVTMFERAITGFENHSKQAIGAVRDLGRAYAQLGDTALAELRLRSAVREFARTFGANDVSTCQSFFYLGLLCRDDGNLVEAADLFAKCLKGYDQCLGPNEVDTLTAAETLGRVYMAQHNLDAALKMLKRAYDGFETKLGVFQIPTLEAAMSLGYLYIKMGNLPEAENMCSFALEGLKKALGPNHRSTLEATQNLGMLYFAQGKLSQSKENYQTALNGLDQQFGPNHIATLRTSFALADTIAATGDYVGAERLYGAAIAGFTKLAEKDSKGAKDCEVLRFGATLNRGKLYSELGNIPFARRDIQEALDGYRRIAGGVDLNTLEAVLSLGKLKDQSMVEAEKLVTRAMNGFENKIGTSHISTLNAVTTLGYLYMDNPLKFDQAETLLVRALRGYQALKMLPKNHPTILEVMNRLGILYMQIGKKAEGETMLRSAIKGFEERFGPDHALALRTVLKLRFPPTPNAKSSVGEDPPYRKRDDPVPTQESRWAVEEKYRHPTPKFQPTPAYATTASLASDPLIQDQSLRVSAPRERFQVVAEPQSTSFQYSSSATSKDPGTKIGASSNTVESRGLPLRTVKPTPSKSPSTRSTLSTVVSVPTRDTSSRAGERIRSEGKDKRPKQLDSITSTPATLQKPDTSRPYTPITQQKQSKNSGAFSQPNSDKFQCSNCPESFWLYEEFRLHELDCNFNYDTPDDLVECDKCTMKFQTESELQGHKFEKHGRGSQNRSTSNIGPRQNRGGQYSNENRIPCEKCTMIFWTESELQGHNIEKHSRGSQGRSRSDNRASPQQRTSISCRKCGLLFPTQVEMDSHETQAHQQREYRQYDTRWAPLTSSSIPESRLNHPCNTCGQLFESMDGVRSHWNEAHKKEYDEYHARYGPRTKSPSPRFPRGEKVVPCTKCSMQFWSEAELAHHMDEMEHDSKDTRCRKCGKYLPSRNKLFEHLKETGHDRGM